MSCRKIDGKRCEKVIESLFNKRRNNHVKRPKPLVNRR